MQRWITVAIAAAALAATGLAQADDHRGQRDRGAHQYRGGHDSRASHQSRGGHDFRGSYQYRGGHDFRGRSWHPAPRYEPRYGYSNHARPGWHAPRRHAWVRGSYLPRAYFGPRYFVRDYGYYGLRAPPVGYGWVRVDGDFLLAALATGFVADALFGGY